MSDLNYNIGQIPVNDTKWSCGVGYVAIPSEIPRDVFIYDSIREGTIMIRTEDGGHYRNCPVSKNIFDEIEWPERTEENGTPIFYVTEPKHQQPVVVGAFNYNDEIIDRGEYEFRMTRQYQNSLVQIVGNSQNSELVFYLQGDVRSDLNIRLANENDRGKLIIDIDGIYSLKSTKNISIFSQESIRQKVGDSEDNSTAIIQDPSQINIRAHKFIVNDGEQAIMLGNMWKEFMDTFIDIVSKSTVSTAIGQMPLLNAAQIAEFKNRTEEILSEYSFTK